MTGIGFASDDTPSTPTADAWLAGQAGFAQGWADQSGNAGGSAFQLRPWRTSPACQKVAGKYQTTWTAHGPQMLSAPDNANLAGLFDAGGYALAAVDMTALGVDQPAGLLTKGSWTFYLYRGGGDASAEPMADPERVRRQWCLRHRALAGPLGRHLTEFEYNSSSPANAHSSGLTAWQLPSSSRTAFQVQLCLTRDPWSWGIHLCWQLQPPASAAPSWSCLPTRAQVSPADKATAARADVKAFYSTA